MSKEKLPPNKTLGGPFESDSHKIVRKHLENKNHVISDEEIRNVRVGMTPANSEERHLTEIVNEIEVDAEPITKKQEKPSGDPITPWDTLEH